MKIIIAGSRFVTPEEFVRAIQTSTLLAQATEIITGKAAGVDTYGELYGRLALIPVKEFPAEWDNVNRDDATIKTRKDGTKYNARAGFVRNEQMARYADGLILIWKNDSKGSEDMLKQAKKYGLQIEMIEI